MRNILMMGNVNSLVEHMKKDGFELCGINTKKDSDEETWIFYSCIPHYDFEVYITFQVNEVDENNEPVAINVVEVKSKLI